MNRLLKDASEISSKMSEFDFNEQELEGKARTKVEYYKPNIAGKKSKAKEELLVEEVPLVVNEPLGYIENVYGVPRVAKEDKYLEPYTNDLLLR
jgi:hypothetical protein